MSKIKFGTVRADGFKFRGYNRNMEMWLSPSAWSKAMDSNRYYFIKKNHGLDRDTYNRMLENQGHCCAICRKEFLGDTKNIHVDHSHATGHVRALLCGNCNKMIGLAKENIDTLRAAIDYLIS